MFSMVLIEKPKSYFMFNDYKSWWMVIDKFE